MRIIFSPRGEGAPPCADGVVNQTYRKECRIASNRALTHGTARSAKCPVG
jgi:hypothetical protein